MLDHARELSTLTCSRSLHDLERDRAFELAVLQLLVMIGEDARQVTEPLRDAHPEIPWSDLVGTRNALLQQYDRVDLGEVWSTVRGDISALFVALALRAMKRTTDLTPDEAAESARPTPPCTISSRTSWTRCHKLAPATTWLSAAEPDGSSAAAARVSDAR